MGITANHFGDDGRHLIHHNVFRRQGAGGIWHSGNDSNIHDNVFEGPTPFQNSVNLIYLGHIIQAQFTAGGDAGGKRNRIHDNVIKGASGAQERYGIVVAATTTDNRIYRNTVDGVATSGIRVDGSANTGNDCQDNDATLTYANGATPGIQRLRGTGSPEGAVFGAIGSEYVRTDGGAGTTHYFKEANPTLNTGWVAK